MDRFKLSAVSYLNTKPLLYGLLRSDVSEQLDMELAIPSECARRLVAGTTDLALVPVAVLAELPDYRIVSDYCIGTNGAVATVGIYGEVPIEAMTSIYLDHHSRTSIMLAQLLLEEHWQLAPHLLPAKEGYLDKIGGTVGGVVIGDRTIGLDQRFPYFYDLGEVWKQHTGLPFVFAAWVSRRELPADFLEQFNEALASGVAKVPELQLLLSSPNPSFDLVHYFTHNIDYHLDAGKREALERFLAYVEQKEVIPG